MKNRKQKHSHLRTQNLISVERFLVAFVSENLLPSFITSVTYFLKVSQTSNGEHVNSRPLQQNILTNWWIILFSEWCDEGLNVTNTDSMSPCVSPSTQSSTSSFFFITDINSNIYIYFSSYNEWLLHSFTVVVPNTITNERNQKNYSLNLNKTH